MTPILAFHEMYVPRMWGGTRLSRVYGKPTPKSEPIGEAWLIADHAECESVVKGGGHAGRTLRDLLRTDARAILGRRAQLTIHGRFPLLLKLLDAGDKLSIQVHPDDEAAIRLKEPDVGKTEMWYVIEGGPDSELYCGMPPELDAAAFDAERRAGRLGQRLTRIAAHPDTAVFVHAGTVHAIGGGCLIAEIQQNSDLTYRIDDWGRVQPDGTPRELHIDKAMQVIHFGSRHAGAAKPLEYEYEGAQVQVLAACRYFVAERVTLASEATFETRGDSFQLCLGLEESSRFGAHGAERDLLPGEALMVSGEAQAFQVWGGGSFLRYYVPDLAKDVAEPLLKAGHLPQDIVALGGDASTSDLAPILKAATRAR